MSAPILTTSASAIGQRQRRRRRQHAHPREYERRCGIASHEWRAIRQLRTCAVLARSLLDHMD